MLLSYGADPNIRVASEPDNTGPLRPPLAELLASNENTSTEEVQLLLKYGARVIMKTQFRDPNGLLNCLSTVPADTFEMLLEATEEFDNSMIRRNPHLTDNQRRLILKKASTPLPLKFQARTFFRKILGRALPESVPSLFIPLTLRRYLLFENI